MEIPELLTIIAAYLGITISMVIALFSIKQTNKNLELSRKNFDEIRKGQLLSTYPFLSQKLGKNESIVFSPGEEHFAHYMLYIKNYGKGPAVNQDFIKYEFYSSGEIIHQGKIPITGAHDILAPDDERPLDLSILKKEDWRPEIKERYDSIWIRLPHEDIQRNKCCNCTKYNREPNLVADFGKEERYWYYSAIPEISSPKCINCEWKHSSNLSTNNLRVGKEE